MEIGIEIPNWYVIDLAFRFLFTCMGAFTGMVLFYTLKFIYENVFKRMFQKETTITTEYKSVKDFLNDKDGIIIDKETGKPLEKKK